MIIIATYSNVSVTYTADGTQTVFSFPFDYLRKAFVFVEADGTALEQGTNFSVSGKTVVFTTAPTAGTKLRIFRETETIPLVSWADASVLKAKDMTIQQVQVLHILEEYKGQYNEDLANMLIIAGIVTDSDEVINTDDTLPVESNVETNDDNLFEEIKPFEETPLFNDRFDDELFTNEVKENKTIFEEDNNKPDSDNLMKLPIDSSNKETIEKEEKVEDMPDMFWVTQEDDNIENNEPTFDEQINKLMNEEQIESSSRRKR